MSPDPSGPRLDTPPPPPAVPPPVSAMSSSFDITKITKLNGLNYCDWKNILEDVLVLKDLWSHLEEAEPAGNDVAHSTWLKNQKHILAIIRLTCEPDIVHLFADATTGTAAWVTLRSTFASKHSTNVMRLEEEFGSARKSTTQSMGEWIASVKSLVAQLRGVGVTISDTKAAHRILNGLGKEYESMRHALQARTQDLTVSDVSDHLLSWDTPARTVVLPLSPVAPIPPVPHFPAPDVYHVASVPAHNNPHRGPMATAMVTTADSSAPVSSLPCSTSLAHQVSCCCQASQSHAAARFHPYASSMFCVACGKSGHLQHRCWTRYPHLKPQWMRDRDHDRDLDRHRDYDRLRDIDRMRELDRNRDFNRQRDDRARERDRSDRYRPSLPDSNRDRPDSTRDRPLGHTAHVATADPPPRSYSPIPPPNPSTYSYLGPDSLPPSSGADPDHAFPTLHDNLANRASFTDEYCYTLRDSPQLLSSRPPSEHGLVHPGDAPGKWLVDSGASSHYSPFRHLFLDLQPIEPPVRILTGNGFIYAEFKGPIPLIIRGPHNTVTHLLLDDVLYVPGLQSRVNLYSIVVLADKQVNTVFGPSSVTFSAMDGTILATGTRVGNCWWLDADVRPYDLCLTLQHDQSSSSASLWHRRMGHLNHTDLIRLQRLSDGISLDAPSVPPSSSQCVPCLVGKQHRTISYFPRRPRLTNGQSRHSCLHIDISGPMQSYGDIAKHLYLAVIVDEDTRFTHANCLHSKDELRACVKEHVALVERRTHDRVLALFSDNEPVILQGAFQEWLRSSGITHYTTQTYSPEMNGLAENAIKQIVTRASAMMADASIPVGFWPEAVRCSAYLKNRSPNKAINMTPFEAYFDTKPNLSHLKVFGCRCYAHIEKENRKKFDSHTVECVFMGYYATERLFAVFDVTHRVMLKKRDVIFFEHVLGHPSMKRYGLAPGHDILGNTLSVADAVLDADIPDTHSVSDCDTIVAPLSPAPNPVPAPSPPSPPQLALMGISPSDDSAPCTSPVIVRDMIDSKWNDMLLWRSPREPNASTSSRAHPSYLLDNYADIYTSWQQKLGIINPLPDISFATDEPDPDTWASAMASPNKGWWLRAAYEEMTQIATMGTFDLTENLPSGRRALSTKWVWKTKRSDDGRIQRFKARWVARGDLQRKVIDYKDTFAPVAMLVSIRILLTLVAVLDLELDQLDVVGAFLNGCLDSDTQVFLRQPQGFTIFGDSRVCALHKSLYGLCQAARAWYNVLHSCLQELGFSRLLSDMAVWKSRKTPASGFEPANDAVSDSITAHDSLAAFIAAHVDDMLCGGSRDHVDRVKCLLKDCFTVKDLGPATVFIGLRIVRDRARRPIYIDQSHYCRDILDLYGLSDCNPCLIPMNPSDHLLTRAKPEECLSASEKTTYQAIIGSLGYLMNCGRPDLAFPVNKIAQFASCPADRHLVAAKRILRYLRGTIDAQLIVGSSSGSLDLRAWFDASWADNPDDSRSTYGYVVLFGQTALI